ncbi:hypothetical protein Csa_023729, partial [Cucumis sativus]
ASHLPLLFARPPTTITAQIFSSRPRRCTICLKSSSVQVTKSSRTVSVRAASHCFLQPSNISSLPSPSFFWRRRYPNPQLLVAVRQRLPAVQIRNHSSHFITLSVIFC